MVTLKITRMDQDSSWFFSSTPFESASQKAEAFLKRNKDKYPMALYARTSGLRFKSTDGTVTPSWSLVYKTYPSE